MKQTHTLDPLPFERVSDWPEAKMFSKRYRFDEMVDALKSGQWVRVPKGSTATAGSIQTNLAYHGVPSEVRSTETHIYIRRFPQEAHVAR